MPSRPHLRPAPAPPQRRTKRAGQGRTRDIAVLRDRGGVFQDGEGECLGMATVRLRIGAQSLIVHTSLTCSNGPSRTYPAAVRTRTTTTSDTTAPFDQLPIDTYTSPTECQGKVAPIASKIETIARRPLPPRSLTRCVRNRPPAGGRADFSLGDAPCRTSLGAGPAPDRVLERPLGAKSAGWSTGLFGCRPEAVAARALAPGLILEHQRPGRSRRGRSEITFGLLGPVVGRER